MYARDAQTKATDFRAALMPTKTYKSPRTSSIDSVASVSTACFAESDVDEFEAKQGTADTSNETRDAIANASSIASASAFYVQLASNAASQYTFATNALAEVLKLSSVTSSMDIDPKVITATAQDYAEMANQSSAQYSFALHVLYELSKLPGAATSTQGSANECALELQGVMPDAYPVREA